MATLGDLVVNLTVNKRQFQRDIGKSQSMVKSFSKAATVAFAATTAAAGGLAAIIATKVLPQFEELDKIAKLSRTTGFGTEALIAYRHGAEQAGVGASMLERGLKRFPIVMGDAINATGSARSAFASLGITHRQLAQSSPEAALKATAEAIKGIESTALRASAANKIFGRSGVELLNFLSQGEDGLNNMRTAADALGMTFSQMELAKVEQANDAMDNVGKAMDSVWKTMAVQMAPAITDIADEMTRFAKDNKDDIRQMARDLGEIAKALAGISKFTFKGVGDLQEWVVGRGFDAAEWVGMLTDPRTVHDVMGGKANPRMKQIEDARKIFAEMRKGDSPFNRARLKEPPKPEVPKGAENPFGFIGARLDKFTPKFIADMQKAGKVFQKELDKFGPKIKGGIKDAGKEADDLRRRAAQIIGRNMNPNEQFTAALKDIEKMKRLGLLDDRQFGREKARLTDDLRKAQESGKPQAELTPGPRFAGVATGADAFSAVLRAMTQHGESKQVKAIKEGTRQSKQNTEHIITAIESSGPEIIEVGPVP